VRRSSHPTQGSRLPGQARASRRGLFLPCVSAQDEADCRPLPPPAPGAVAVAAVAREEGGAVHAAILPRLGGREVVKAVKGVNPVSPVPATPFTGFAGFLRPGVPTTRVGGGGGSPPWLLASWNRSHRGRVPRVHRTWSLKGDVPPRPRCGRSDCRRPRLAGMRRVGSNAGASPFRRRAMSFALGPFASSPQPVAAHDAEFKYLPVRRYAEDGVLACGAAAGGQAVGRMTPRGRRRRFAARSGRTRATATGGVRHRPLRAEAWARLRVPPADSQARAAPTLPTGVGLHRVRRSGAGKSQVSLEQQRGLRGMLWN
jgi:hypothetical protein